MPPGSAGAHGSQSSSGCHTHSLALSPLHVPVHAHAPGPIRDFDSFTYWTLGNILSPQAHVGAVLNGGALLLLVIPAAVGVSGS